MKNYIGTQYLKPFDISQSQLEQLKDLKKKCKELKKLSEEHKKELDKIIDNIDKLITGYYGEKEINYQLKTFDDNAYILYDTYFYLNTGAQIDFIFITNKSIYLIEVKNIRGENICYNLKNNKITIYYNNTHKHITTDIIEQSECHFRIISSIIKSDTNLRKYINRLQDIIVFTNTNGNIYSKDEPTDKLVLSNNLINTIKTLDNNKHTISLSPRKMKDIAERLLNYSSPNPEDYIGKLEKETTNISNTIRLNKKFTQNDKELENALIEFRKQQKDKAFCVFNNDALHELVRLRPKTIKELLNIRGFGDKNTSKYGNDIIAIIKKYSNN